MFVAASLITPTEGNNPHTCPSVKKWMQGGRVRMLAGAVQAAERKGESVLLPVRIHVQTEPAT